MYIVTNSGTEVKGQEIRTDWFDFDLTKRQELYLKLTTIPESDAANFELFVEDEDIEQLAKRGAFTLEQVKKTMAKYAINYLKFVQPNENSRDQISAEIRGHRTSDDQWIDPGINCNKRDLMEYLTQDKLN